MKRILSLFFGLFLLGGAIGQTVQNVDANNGVFRTRLRIPLRDTTGSTYLGELRFSLAPGDTGLYYRNGRTIGSRWTKVPETISGGGSTLPGGSGTELQFRNGSLFGAAPTTSYDFTNGSLFFTRLAGDSALIRFDANYTGVKRWMTFRPPVKNDSTTQFSFWSALNPNADGTRSNHVMIFGSNYDGAKPGIPAMWDAWESNWFSGGVRFIERHYEARIHATNENVRLFSSTMISRDSLGNSTNQWDFRGNVFSVSDLKNNAYFSVGKSGNTTATNSVVDLIGFQPYYKLTDNTGPNQYTLFQQVGPDLQVSALRNITLSSRQSFKTVYFNGMEAYGDRLTLTTSSNWGSSGLVYINPTHASTGVARFAQNSIDALWILNNRRILINSSTDNAIGQLQITGKMTLSTVDSTALPANGTFMFVDPSTGEIKRAIPGGGGITFNASDSSLRYTYGGNTMVYSRTKNTIAGLNMRIGISASWNGTDTFATVSNPTFSTINLTGVSRSASTTDSSFYVNPTTGAIEYRKLNIGTGGGMVIGNTITSATANSILFAGSGAKLSQKNTDFYYDSTNRFMYINNTTGAAGIRLQTSNGGGYLDLRMDNNFGGDYVALRNMANSDNGKFHIVMTGTNRFTVLQNGNVGIGITSPTSLFHVVGSTRFDLGSDASYDMMYRGTGGNLNRLANATGTNMILTGTTGAAPTWKNQSEVFQSAFSTSLALTNTTNITSSSSAITYQQVGDVINFWGTVSITPTASGAIELNMALPIGSAITNDYHVSGMGVAFDKASEPVEISYNSVGGTIRFRNSNASTGVRKYFIQGSYKYIAP